MFLYNITMMARPTLTSAAATIIIKNTKIWASLANVAESFATVAILAVCILLNATSSRFTAFNINSMHIKISIALRRMSTPTIPIVNKASDNVM